MSGFPSYPRLPVADTLFGAASASLRRARGRYYSAHRFYLAIVVLLLLASYSIITAPANPSGEAVDLRFDAQDHFSRQYLLDPRGEGGGDQCRRVHHAKDKCAWVREYCTDDEGGLFSYLSLYYCYLPDAKPFAFVIIIAWLALLFSTVGIAASDFLCVDLSTLANSMGMSESLAGVTLLAFGNGSPDVFSTFAAMGADSGSLAVGELLGAACFITSVVAGSMALVRPFRVARRSFIRDIGFFLVSAAFALYAISDGKLPLWECAVMVAFYVFYVIVVVSWHWYLGHKRRKLQRDLTARAHFHIAENQELEIPEEVDGDYDDPGMGNSQMPDIRGASDEDFGTLERSSLVPHSPVHPRSPAQPVWKAGEDRDVEILSGSPDSNEEESVEADYLPELQKNMRLNHAIAGQRHRTTNPIRPSLMGALEFRSVLDSLQRARNIHSPIYLRRYSDEAHMRDFLERVNGNNWESGISRNRAITAPEGAGVRVENDNGPGIDINVRPPSPSGPENGEGPQGMEEVNTDIQTPRIDVRPPSLESQRSAVSSQDVVEEARNQGQSLSPIPSQQSPSPASSEDSRMSRGPLSGKPKPKLVISTDVSPTPLPQPVDHNASSDQSPRHTPRLSPQAALRSVPWERERGELERGRGQTRDTGSQIAPPRPSIHDHNYDPNYLAPDREIRIPHSARSSPPARRAYSPISPRSPRSARSPAAKSPRWYVASAPHSPRVQSPVSSRRGTRTPSPFALSPYGSGGLVMSPFPAYSDDGASNSVVFPVSELPLEATLPVGIVPPTETKTWKWWPSSILPAPAVVMATLFPTLYGWGGKTIWEKFLGIISAPSVLVLTLTLPVVEPREPDADGKDEEQEVAAAVAVSRHLAENNTSAQRGTVSEEQDRLGPGRRASRSDSEAPMPPAFTDRAVPGALAQNWNSWLLCLQLVTGPFFISLVVWSHLDESSDAYTLLLPTLITLGVSAVLLVLFIFFTKKYDGREMPPRSRPLFALLGFAVSIAWISTLSQEIVNALKTIGVILNISDALLGLTVFAFGNSIGDLIADITVARLGHPVMALAACLGSPMLNILLGIGLCGIYMNFRPVYMSTAERALTSTPATYHFTISRTLLISGGELLVHLGGLLLFVPLNKWRMDKKIGLVLIALWAAMTITNVVISLTLERGTPHT